MIKMKIFLLLFLLSGLGSVSASESIQLPIDKIKYVYDGDTFMIECIEGFRCDKGKLSIRALGLDTPEMRGDCQYEKNLARAAKRHLVDLKNNAATFTVIPDRKRPYDRYGRLLASVSFDGIDWAESMITAQLGRAWTGSRGGWCS